MCRDALYYLFHVEVRQSKHLVVFRYGGQMIFAGVITTGDLISYMLFALQVKCYLAALVQTE